MNDIYEERNGYGAATSAKHELDPAALEMIQQADIQLRTINDQINGMLTYFAKSRGLTAGQWRLSENRRELVPVQQSPL